MKENIKLQDIDGCSNEVKGVNRIEGWLFFLELNNFEDKYVLE